MHTVSVQRVPHYEPESLYDAVCRHFEALEVEKDLSPDTRVLLKPNLLAGRDPSLGVTTHPMVLAALARRLRELGVRSITLADSSGGLYTPAALRKIYTACGLDTLRDVMTLNEDTATVERNGFTLLRPVMEADFVINCPKLKTHGLTAMTAGVKNLFGCIPGLKKPELHCIHPGIEDFGTMLLRLSETVKPSLTFLDAVDCMEGNGPGGGKVRFMGYTLCARNVYALDEQAAALMALSPMVVPTLRLARRQALMNPAEIALVGDPLEPANPPFLLPDSYLAKESVFSTHGIFHRLFRRTRVRPHIVTERCIGCGHCAESCPQHIITLVAYKAVIDPKTCISCYCCQEMCPVQAVETGPRTRQ
ncbi:MAG: DUF362 domain-containing protein [Candidatus Limiplasma sp.]|nr:DUF362 domain-containing protein [Candidatus Limiplasma sp.]